MPTQKQNEFSPSPPRERTYLSLVWEENVDLMWGESEFPRIKIFNFTDCC